MGLPLNRPGRGRADFARPEVAESRRIHFAHAEAAATGGNSEPDQEVQGKFPAAGLFRPHGNTPLPHHRPLTAAECSQC